MSSFSFSFAFLTLGGVLLGIGTLLLRKLKLSHGPVISALLIGGWIIFVALFPYWLFGRFSAIGWYDEYDAIIPYAILAAFNPVNYFLHQIAGGTSVGDLTFATNHSFSLYIELIRLLGGQGASLLFRFVGLLELYFGGYWLARRLFAMGQLGSIVAGLTTVFATAYPYAWMLGGYGWTLSMVIWCGNLFFSELPNSKRLILAAVLGILAAATSHFFFLVPWTCAYLLLLSALLPNSTLVLLRRGSGPLAIFGLVTVACEWQTIMSIIPWFDQSARLMGIDSLSAFRAHFGHNPTPSASSSAAAFAGALGDFNKFALRGLNFLFTGNLETLLGFPLTVVFLVGALISEICLASARNQWRFLATSLGFIAAIFLLTFMERRFNVPLVSQFRWDTTYLVLTPIVGIAWGRLTEGKAQRKKGTILRQASLVIFAGTVLFSAASLAQRSLEGINAYGGWAVLSGYPILGNLGRRYPLVRAGSVPEYYPKQIIGPFNGLSVIDGTLPTFTWRRTAFWFLTLKSPPQKVWSTSRQNLGRAIEEVDLPALLMTNTGFLLSTAANIAGFKEIASERGLRLADSPLPAAHLLSKLLPGFSLMPPLHIFKAGDPWPRVFSPVHLEAAIAPDTSPAYYIKLRSLPRDTVLIPQNAPVWLRGAANEQVSIIAARETPNGITVQTKGNGGFLVYNQEYNHGWGAYCDKARLPLSAVNGIMMITKVPLGCTRVTFQHD